MCVRDLLGFVWALNEFTNELLSELANVSYGVLYEYFTD